MTNDLWYLLMDALEDITSLPGQDLVTLASSPELGLLGLLGFAPVSGVSVAWNGGSEVAGDRVDTVGARRAGRDVIARAERHAIVGKSRVETEVRCGVVCRRARA